MSAVHPCLNCGACCAYFRVSFYWAEADDATQGGVPVELTDALPPNRRAMKGTNAKQPRCVALEGTIGERVCCSIYSTRPQACREFGASWEHGVCEERCDKARARHGLEALKPEDWMEFTGQSPKSERND